MPTPLVEVVAAIKEAAAFERMYGECLQMMAVRGHIEWPAPDDVARRQRRLALLAEGADLVGGLSVTAAPGANPLTARQD